MIRIFGRDLLVVLDQKISSESLVEAILKVYPNTKVEDAIKIQGYVEKVIRIKEPTTLAAIKKTRGDILEKEKGDRLKRFPCQKCWSIICREVFQENGRHCAICGGTEHLSCHHIVPRSERGPTEVWNLMPLCEVCHNFIECHPDRPRTHASIVRCGLERIS